jgi:hypothetical protein
MFLGGGSRNNIQSNRASPALMQMGKRNANGEGKMSSYYPAVSALVFAAVALGHLTRLLQRWPVQLGPWSVPMSVSWIGLPISALLAIWGLTQSGH